MNRTEETLRLIIDTSPIGICTVDPKGNFVSTNSAYEKMLGYSKKELREMSFYDVTHQHYRPENKELFQQMFTLESTSFKMEKKYIRKDGSVIDVSVHATGVSDNGSKIKFGTAFVEDITEYNKIQLQLQKNLRQEALHTLTTGIAQDFNEILTVISAYAQFTKSCVSENPVAHEHLNEILTASKKASRIVRQMAAFSDQGDLE
jgi:PAS domain S-box-containing protein